MIESSSRPWQQTWTIDADFLHIFVIFVDLVNFTGTSCCASAYVIDFRPVLEQVQSNSWPTKTKTFPGANQTSFSDQEADGFFAANQYVVAKRRCKEM